MKKFDLEAAKSGAPIVTRDGREARFVGHIPEAQRYSVVAYILGEAAAQTFTSFGELYSGEESRWDLFMKPQKRTVWVNMYKGRADEIHSVVYWNEFNALNGKSEKSLAIAVPIEIEIP